jgi:hypothetical protein
MNPTQKIAKLREQIEDLDLLWGQAERRMRDVEKQITLVLCAVLLQTLFGAAAIYLTLLR